MGQIMCDPRTTHHCPKTKYFERMICQGSVWSIGLSIAISVSKLGGSSFSGLHYFDDRWKTSCYLYVVLYLSPR
jgi:hypothetical protein